MMKNDVMTFGLKFLVGHCPSAPDPAAAYDLLDQEITNRSQISVKVVLKQQSVCAAQSTSPVVHHETIHV